MNEYQRALMSGQFSPAQYMQQNRQSQNFGPMRQAPMAPIPQMGQGPMGQGQGMGGMQSLLDVLKKKNKSYGNATDDMVKSGIVPPDGVPTGMTAGPSPTASIGGDMSWIEKLRQGARLFGGK